MTGFRHTPHRRILRSVLGSDPNPFRPLEPECKTIQFDGPLTPIELEQAASLIAQRPDVELYVYGAEIVDLDFLRYFRTLRRLHLALYNVEDLTGFTHVRSTLQALRFGQTKKVFSVRFVEGLPHLQELFLAGHKKDIAEVSRLRDLTSLGFSRITLPNLSILLPLTGLRKLSLLLGGTKNLDVLAGLPDLEDLYIMRVNKLSDLGVLRELRGLQRLKLDWIRTVISLPSFETLSRLETVELDTMKGLIDLSPIAAAPVLRKLSAVGMPQLTPESFRCFLSHPSLQELRAYTGKKAVDGTIRAMFPLVASARQASPLH
jgi:hypothetical protein